MFDNIYAMLALFLSVSVFLTVGIAVLDNNEQAEAAKCANRSGYISNGHGAIDVPIGNAIIHITTYTKFTGTYNIIFVGEDNIVSNPQLTHVFGNLYSIDYADVDTNRNKNRVSDIIKGINDHPLFNATNTGKGDPRINSIDGPDDSGIWVITPDAGPDDSIGWAKVCLNQNADDSYALFIIIPTIIAVATLLVVWREF